jgi:Probable lipoprotein LpqN
MKRTAASSGATIAIVAIAIGLSGCSSSPSSNNAASKTSATGSGATSTTAKPQSKVAPRVTAQGPNPSIASYFQDSHITATPVHKGDRGAPTINFPIPDGWADAGPDTPATAYWAIVDNGPEAAKYTPSIVATLTKLEGDNEPDPQKILNLAPGELKNLPGFQPKGEGGEDNFAGSPAYQFAGTWVQDGQTKAVAQKTVGIDGKDAIYLLRLNADCLPDQIDKALPATITIDEKTTINV